MLKRFFCMLLMLCLLMPCAMAEEEEDDISFADLLEGVASLEIMDDGTVVSDADEVDALIAEAESIYEADGSILITITATGDFTLANNAKSSTKYLNQQLKKNNGDINFTMANVRDILMSDDLTIVNFEGTLTTSTKIPSNKRENDFLFSADPAYVSVLTDNGIEAVSLENNHVMDFGDVGYEDTKQALRDAGVVYSNSEEMGVIEVKGVEICMLSYLCIDRYDKLWAKVPEDIAAAKAQYPIVIVNFHWGNELDYSPTKNQIRMGRLAVDAGADLVIGNHSHRMNPIEYYNGAYICYSLGNFCFSGNSKPRDMSSFIFQQRFRVRNGRISNDGFRIIPIRISSRTNTNDLIPTVYTDPKNIDSVITVLKSNSKNLEYAVEDYPLSWPEE